ncbi:ribonuclease H2 subunit A-like isoform X2 [Anneissia japonica]|uniref:ribonuclease H2 subunit A-like isoform X1 n=1 Tax=Anneissia japonica TaxID=1529436 RepID=UPI00142579C3|nr:ribonuclease H2 subunit A-like isoform X1 [Anneissia japonica]XP_033126427.1 ribonuclease H2 subunit A-like isoform X2 [Anneissia japonica]
MSERSLEQVQSDNISNCIIQSDVPSVCKEEPCCLGIDEAGRGPVLGPMVYGICYCPVSEKEKLKDMGFADSKTLSEEKREGLFTSIEEAGDLLGFEVEVISPTFISNNMLKRSKYSLNAISMDSAIGLVKLALKNGVNLTEVYVDTVGPAVKYQEKLQGIFPDLTITVESKADAKFPIVSAASICAKVVRDRVLKTWTFSEGDQYTLAKDVSGYPSDPSTKQWLRENIDKVFGFPSVVRFSWSTASFILDEKAVKVFWDDEDEDEDTKGTKSVLSYFAPTDSEKFKKHKFFEERHLTQVTNF